MKRKSAKSTQSRSEDDNFVADEAIELTDSGNDFDNALNVSEGDYRRMVARRFIEIMREKRELRAHVEDSFYTGDALL
jgi:hypothetical protein